MRMIKFLLQRQITLAVGEQSIHLGTLFEHSWSESYHLSYSGMPHPNIFALFFSIDRNHLYSQQLYFPKTRTSLQFRDISLKVIRVSPESIILEHLEDKVQ